MREKEEKGPSSAHLQSATEPLPRDRGLGSLANKMLYKSTIVNLQLVNMIHDIQIRDTRYPDRPPPTANLQSAHRASSTRRWRRRHRAPPSPVHRARFLRSRFACVLVLAFVFIAGHG
eukprot:scaffold109416_cov33-Tisochrysis_lutea.AAC.4